MIMRNQIFSIGLIVAATFALSNCTKEINHPVQIPDSAGIPFELTASSIDTKTAAGDEFTTEWVANDALSVFHTKAGSNEFGENDEFTILSENLTVNKFTGELTSGLETGNAYDWYVFYPYNENFDGADLKIGYTNYGSKCYNGAVSTAQKQTGNNSKAHLAGEYFPLYGKVSSLPSGDAVSVSMQHLMSVVELKVTNNASEEFTVTGIEFSTPVNVVGSFYYNTSNGTYEPSSNAGTYNSTTAALSVVDAEPIPVDGSATFYLGIIPVKLTEGEVKMTVITDKGTQVKAKNLTSDSADDIQFTAGTIKKMHFDFNAEVAIKTVSLPWTENFGSSDGFENYDLGNYTIVDGGSATKLYNETLAGGTAPEILIGKGGGAFKVNIDLDSYVGKLTLSFNANSTTRTEITSDAANVIIGDLVAVGQTITCLITVPAGLDILPLTFTNNSGSNVRIDNISLVKGGKEPQSIHFATPSYVLNVGSDAADKFKGQTVTGANTAVTYESSNKNVATVDSETGVVTLVAAGETTITATAAETEDYASASASYTIVYTNKDYVSLPWSFEGGTKSDLTSQVGVTASGLGDDYAASHSPYQIKFDTTGDYVIVKTDSAIGKLSIGLKMLGGSTASSFTVYESADGQTYTELETLSWSGAQYDVKTVETTRSFKNTSRYVKFSFTKVSNIGVGPISITKAE